ncbi:hypothetical protein [Stenotrophomonas pavanii]|uniref:hypothetical protein n=1 Tax=Stenotrophomonas pavanii TaxID=487698 RepID=UPI0039C6C62B
MRTKKTNTNLYLYSFLGLLFGLAASVDVGSLAQHGVDNQTSYIQESMRSLD